MPNRYVLFEYFLREIREVIAIAINAIDILNLKAYKFLSLRDINPN